MSSQPPVPYRRSKGLVAFIKNKKIKLSDKAEKAVSNATDDFAKNLVARADALAILDKCDEVQAKHVQKAALDLGSPKGGSAAFACNTFGTLSAGIGGTNCVNYLLGALKGGIGLNVSVVLFVVGMLLLVFA